MITLSDWPEGVSAESFMRIQDNILLHQTEPHVRCAELKVGTEIHVVVLQTSDAGTLAMPVEEVPLHG